MKLEDIKTILIIGAGTMGQQIGFQCAVCGFDVVMYDLSEAKIVKDPQQIKNADFMKTYVDKGKLGEKAGKGFYSYPNPTFSKQGFIANKPESN